jgi:carbohydrate kinase (thermoresistant glucokinase family)
MPSPSEPITTSDTNPPRIWLLMGVCGCGKTAVGEALAAQLGAAFVDADALHPPENVAKMSAKIPLTDADRQPWLERVRREVMDATPPGRVTVLGCSALKRSYRRILMDGAPDVRLIHLHGSRELIAARLAARKGHFMPPELLDSQLRTLEVPGAEEGVIVSIEGGVEEVAERCLAAGVKS